MITSTANPRVKFARTLAHKKERVAQQQFLVEGVRLIQEAARAGFVPALVFYQPNALVDDARAQNLLAQLKAQTPQVYAVDERVMHALAETETPQGLAAVYPLPRLPLPNLLNTVLVLDRVRDPGNVGTILRTAWAAKVGAILFAPETADALNPKVVRAAMGAHFHVPLVPQTWDEIEIQLNRFARVYLAEADGTLDYRNADWAMPMAIIVGGEAEGASAEARRLATATVSIPMPGDAESLNVAVATALLLFESLRPPRDKATPAPHANHG